MGTTLAGFVYPEVCGVCDGQRAGPDLSYVCHDCRRRVTRIREPYCDRCGLPYAGDITVTFHCRNCAGQEFAFETARSAVTAQETVLQAIHRYKYHQALYLEEFLAGLLVEAAAPRLRRDAWDAIVPVPLFPAKQRDRGFNQAERLAGHLSRATGIRLETGWVRRVEPTRTQTRLSREERRQNVRGAFACRATGEPPPMRVLVVDDVFTTGSTTSACAKALRDAGAGHVCVWTLARGI